MIVQSITCKQSPVYVVFLTVTSTFLYWL